MLPVSRHASWVHIQSPGWQRLHIWNDCLKTAALSCIVTLVTRGALRVSKRGREGGREGDIDGRGEGERLGARDGD